MMDLTLTRSFAGAWRSGVGAAVLMATAAGGTAGAEDREERIGIELNKLETTDEGCRSLFIFENTTDHALDRFQVDLILFDPKGVFTRQVLLDMAPLHADKKTVASFLLGQQSCTDIGSILVNDIPTCQNGTGGSLDCVALLEVSSKSDVPLEK